MKSENTKNALGAFQSLFLQKNCISSFIVVWIASFVLCDIPVYAQTETFTAGAYIVDMGQAVQTEANGLKPYGFIYDLMRNYQVPAYWAIDSTKSKDGTDFTADGKAYKGGSFIIPSEFAAEALPAITAWRAKGVVIDGPTAAGFTALNYGMVTSFPNVVIDDQSDNLITPIYTTAEVPAAAYNIGPPGLLDTCDDVFVLPHANPTWAVHSSLLTFNNNGGFIWAGCHAVSVLENLDDPADPDADPDMNFLSESGLVHFQTPGHDDGTPPYTYLDHGNPVMQFIGDLDDATTNGSEQIYLPANPDSWRNTTTVAVYDPDHPDIPGLSPGEAAVLVYGRGFGNPANGMVFYEGGHDLHKNSNPDNVAAQRAYLNFLVMAGIERRPETTINMDNQLSCDAPIPVSGTVSQGEAPYTNTWSSTCGGTFADPNSLSTTYTTPVVASDTTCYNRLVTTDACGRFNFAVEVVTIKVPVASVVKSGSPSTVNPGDTVTYTITISNTGNVNAYVNTVTDNLPAGFAYVPGSASGLTTADPAIAGQQLTWNGSWVLAPGASTSLTYRATAAASAGVFDGTTTIGISCINPPITTGSTTPVTVTVADLSLAATVSDAAPATGENITFTITVSNAGPSSGTGIQVKDTLPAGMTYISNSPSKGSFNSATGIWTVGTLASGSNATLQLTVRVNTSVPITNSAEVTAANESDPDSTPNNNAPAEDDQASTSIDAHSDLVITGPVGTVNTTTHDVTGTVDPFSVVTMEDPVTGVVITVTADVNGNVVFPNVVFPEGPETYTVTATDPQGNVSSDAATVVIDTTNFITVISPPPNSTINVTTSDVTGKTDPNSTVTLVEPSTGDTLTTTADGTGNFTFTDVSFVTGANTLDFTSTDPVGNVAAISTTVTVDPNINLSITSIAHGATYGTTYLELAGETDPNSTVTTTHPTTGAPLSTTADAAGNYTFDVLAFPAGVQTQTVNATDTHGNSASTSVTFTIDTSNTNTITSPNTFTTSYPVITGTTDPSSTVTFQHPVTGESYTVTANTAGVYTFPAIYFPDGGHAITTTSTDPLGNVATDSANITVSTSNPVDITAPPGNSVVDTPTTTITGTTNPNSTVTVVDPVTGGTVTTTADGNGNFTTPIINLNPGANVIPVTSTDPYGVSSTINHSVTYDPNITLNILTPANNSTSYDTDHTVSGETKAGATVTMTHPTTGALLTTVADAAGDYSFANLPFPRGTNVVTVSATDGVNSATTSSTFTITALGVDATLEASERTVLGNPIYIVVSDLETQLDSNAIDTVQVVVTNPNTGDSETRTLVESGVNTGVFRGQLNTVESAVSDGSNSGTLSVLYGDTVTTTYVDQIQADGSTNAQITDTTLITNDGLKIQVNVHSETGTESVALANTNISIIEFESNDQAARYAAQDISNRDLSSQVVSNSRNYVTNSAGEIPSAFISRMKTGFVYRVLVYEQINSIPYSQSDEFSLTDVENAPIDNRGIRTLTLVLDPAGYVYDAVTGDRVNGADVTLYHQDGTPVAGPFSFFTAAPSENQTNPQLSGSSGVNGGFEFIGSGATTDLAAGYYYITVTFQTNPVVGDQYFPVTLTPGTWAGIQAPYAGQLFYVDPQNQPIGMRIPLNLRAPLVLQKETNKDAASVGDIVTFTISVTNRGSDATDAATPVIVRDTLPVGLTYINGSAVTSRGTALSVTPGANGVLDFNIGRLQGAGNAAGRDSITFHYHAAVDTSTRSGNYLLNTAYALIDQAISSNRDSAVVKVIDDPILDRATLIGRVFVDTDENGRHDAGEPGLGNVGLVMEDGTYVTTDSLGKYSVPGAKAGMEGSGLRAITIDRNTLPPDAGLTTPDALFVTLAEGSLNKVNFGVKNTGEVATQPAEEVSANGDTDTPPADNRKHEKLFVGMFDTSTGDYDSGASAITRPDEDIFPEGFFSKGRIAYFFEGPLGEKYHLKSSYDSHKQNTTEIYEHRERHLYYPTYGDDSNVKFLAQTQGKFFLDASSPSANLLVGNYQVHFEDTELADINRSLTGVKLKVDRESSVREDAPSSHVTMFATNRKQLHARTEFRSTGGTQYYLAHSKIVPGSEKVTVQIRDSLIPEKVISTLQLKQGVDYEIDYVTGGMRLFTPVTLYSDSETLYNYSLQSGNPIWIVVEYAYTPEQNQAGTSGARALRWTKWGIGLGGTYLSEKQDGKDHLLGGLDLHVKSGGKEVLGVEWAKSRFGGLPWLASLDAGRSFVLLGQNNNSSGSAYKTKLNVLSLNNVEWENYYYLVDSGFSGQAFSERGIRRAGTSFKYKHGKRLWGLKYTNAKMLAVASPIAQHNSAGGRARSTVVDFQQELTKGDIKVEYFRNYTGTGHQPFGIRRGSTDSLSTRYNRIMSDRIVLSLTQQLTFSTHNNKQTTLGVKYKMNDKLVFSAEGTYASQGTGAGLGFERNTGKVSRTYFNVSSSTSSETGSKVVSTNAGVSQSISANSDAYVEYGNTSRDDEAVSRKTMGINHKFKASKNLLISFTAGRSQERSSLHGGYFTNNGVVTTELDGGDGHTTTTTEFRRQTGSITKKYFSHQFTADAEIREDLFSFGEYQYNITTNLETDRPETKYTRAILGFAYRPTRNDRLNVLLKTGRIRDLRTLALNDSLNTDSIATVLSLEGIYDLSKELTINEKIASKYIRETTAPLPQARVHTTLWITGLNWRPTPKLDFRTEYRTRHQPTQFNMRDGASVEGGYTFKEKIRLGIGYNFSSYSDDEFANNRHSFKGVIIRLSGKFSEL